MSEETPERLRRFRATYARDDARVVWFPRVLAAVSLIALGAIGMKAAESLRGVSTASPASRGGLTAEQWRSYAIRLEERNLPEQALRAYEAYLECAALPDQERSRVCYSLAKLASDANHYEEALAYLYQSELLNPGSDLKPEIDKQIVVCLEALGRPGQLAREVRQRSGADPEAVNAGEVVLAEARNHVFTEADLDRELARLPESARDSLSAADKKAEFVKNLMTQRVLVDRAFRAGLGKDPDIEAVVKANRDALLVERLLQTQVKAPETPAEDDIRHFYESEQKSFTPNGASQALPFEKVKEKAAQMLAAQRKREAVKSYIDQVLTEEGVAVHTDRLQPAEAQTP
ncbi:MAG: hypothetical protein IT364_15810 [Candidatus Hydrogenedentes bacterium]|nr:hypothetical protein [Candidatus Hydrogenedentota bacterium]